MFPHTRKRLARESLNAIQGIGQSLGQPPDYLFASATYWSQVLNLPSDLGKYGFTVVQRDLDEIRHRSAPSISS